MELRITDAERGTFVLTPDEFHLVRNAMQHYTMRQALAHAPLDPTYNAIFAPFIKESVIETATVRGSAHHFTPVIVALKSYIEAVAPGETEPIEALIGEFETGQQLLSSAAGLTEPQIDSIVSAATIPTPEDFTS